MWLGDRLEAWSRDWLRCIGQLFHLAKRRRAVWQPDLPLAAQRAEFQAVQQRLEQAFASLLGRARRELPRLASQWDGASGSVQALLNAQGKALHSLLAHQDGGGRRRIWPRGCPGRWTSTAGRSGRNPRPWREHGRTGRIPGKAGTPCLGPPDPARRRAD